MQSSSLLSPSPSPSLSFNTYSSSDKLAKIAARVVQEFQADSDFDDYVFHHTEEEEGQGHVRQQQQQEGQVKNKNEEENDDNDEFEFPFVCIEPDSSPIPADEIFYNGQIRPFYPLFNTDLLLGEGVDVQNSNSSTPKTSSPVRLPLRRLFIEERERDNASCSSSEADELDGVPAGTYCVWTPKAAEEESPGRCKKSNSTGSSKRWKFRDLLHRSNSEGKDNFVFLTPSNKKGEGKGTKEAATNSGNGNAKVKGVGEAPPATAHEAHYVRNRAAKEGDKRRSYLPYKQDLVGFFANVNGLSRNLQPF